MLHLNPDTLVVSPLDGLIDIMLFASGTAEGRATRDRLSAVAVALTCHV